MEKKVALGREGRQRKRIKAHAKGRKNTTETSLQGSPVDHPHLLCSDASLLICSGVEVDFPCNGPLVWLLAVVRRAAAAAPVKAAKGLGTSGQSERAEFWRGCPCRTSS